MPVYQLIDEPLFPPLSHAEPDGLLAIGGDLSPQRLLLAYSSGIFPWYNENDPILWWSPDPRCILEPAKIKVSRSLEKRLRKGRMTVTLDKAFQGVISACAGVRVRSGEGTWITEEMKAAYCHLHEIGFAHSVECWLEGKLVGGLYGLCLGRCFFGESMFSLVSDASKVALVLLARELAKEDFEIIDCQMPSDHLKRLGARGISREDFVNRMRRGGVMPSIMPERGFFPEGITPS